MSDKYKLVLLLVFFTSISFCQDTINQKNLTHNSHCIFFRPGTDIPFTGVAYEKLRHGEINYYPYENGIITGVAVGYYKNGNISFKKTMKYGDGNGEETGYYKSGKIKSHWNNETNEVSGEEIWYYENGQIELVFQKKNGKLNGKSITYSKKGIKESDAEYENDVLTNVTYYWDDGVIYKTVKYINGKKVK